MTFLTRWLDGKALLILACAWAAQAVQAEWRPAAGPLLTRWAKEIDPAQVHSEYPRPQMVRERWLNLNGLWDYAIVPASAPAPASYAGQILVPFPIESALSGVMRRLEAQQALYYRRTFEAPAGWADQRVRLHFGAVDWEATVWLNGRELGAHRGGYDGFTLDLTDALKRSGPQELVVRVTDPTEADQPRGKQSRRPEGIFYTPSSGLWQTVWIEPVPGAAIAALRLTPDVDAGAVRVRVIGDGAVGTHTIELVARSAGQEVGRATGPVNQELSVPLAERQLWTPDRPHLYDLEVRLRDAAGTVDQVRSYFGLRKVSLVKDAEGRQRLALNGEPLFQVGTLDQGFWPDGLYTAPSDAALRYDVEVLKELGFNFIRKHVKVEPDRWYYWCDRLGVVVWQDMPSGNNRTAESHRQFETELQRMVEGLHNHPSIIMWVVFNEGWGQYDTERLSRWVKELDGSRLVNNASGWTDRKVGDVMDMHMYPGPGSPPPEPARAAVLGEFGGLGLGIEGHTWSQRTWGYQGMRDTARLTSRYVALLGKVWALRENPGLSAAVYTQTTDVETECNGLLTYDRAILKVDLAKARAANLGQGPRVRVEVLAPTSQTAPVAWKWSLAPPPETWFRPDFDDAAWKEGPGGFGTEGTPGAVVRTKWDSADIWLRRSFTLADPPPQGLQVRIHHDEDAEVYLNGVLVAKLTGYLTDYDDVELPPEGAKTLRVGANCLAIHCHQTAGGQYVDAGLVRVVELPPAQPVARP